jgi:hypothetical protein
MKYNQKGTHMNMLDKFNEDWKANIDDIFDGKVPKEYEWRNISEIVRVLNVIASRQNSNHMFYPTGGGEDVVSANISVEKNCIEINTGGLINVMYPHSLRFEQISSVPMWSYFRLELDNLEPTNIYEYSNGDSEELTDLGGVGEYVDRMYWDVNEFEGEKLPIGSRVVTRFFKGAFVIFSKGSVYNKISATYDGRHSKMDAATFKSYIEKMESKFNEV